MRDRQTEVTLWKWGGNGNGNGEAADAEAGAEAGAGAGAEDGKGEGTKLPNAVEYSDRLYHPLEQEAGYEACQEDIRD